MELRTVMLMLAIGSFLFAILLIIFKFRKEAPQEVPYWIVAKFLQGVGSLILYFKTTTYDVITMTANLILLLGCAYEVWVIRILSGHTVKRWVHLVTSALIALVCTSTLFLSSTVRTGIIFFLQSILYILPAVFLFMKSDFKSYLKSLLRICYLITGVIFLTTSIIAFVFPSFIDSEAGRMFLGVIPATSFCIFLISGFILLMLAKERTDTLVKAMEKSLKESEIRFQRIVETSIEGILIFDENYKITFVNKNMASMLGYNTKELLGKSYISLFPEDKLDIYYRQEKLRKTGEH
ncbi:MAG: PAS domain-containing protein [Bacilli bacterium]|jgi:PAS domain-containing protein